MCSSIFVQSLLLIDFVQKIDRNLTEPEYDKVSTLSPALIQNAMCKRTSDVWCCFLNFSSWRPSGMWRLKSHTEVINTIRTELLACQWSLLMIWGRIALLCIYVQLSLSIQNYMVPSYSAISTFNQMLLGSLKYQFWITKWSYKDCHWSLQRKVQPGPEIQISPMQRCW